MFIFGLILVILGYVLGVTALAAIGWLVLVAGAVLFVIGFFTGDTLFGRRYWY